MKNSGSNFKKGETSLHVGKNNKEEPNKPATKNVTNNSSKKGERKQIHQQQQSLKSKGSFTARRPFSPMVEGSNFQRKIQNSFPP